MEGIQTFWSYSDSSSPPHGHRDLVWSLLVTPILFVSFQKNSRKPFATQSAVVMSTWGTNTLAKVHVLNSANTLALLMSDYWPTTIHRPPHKYMSTCTLCVLLFHFINIKTLLNSFHFGCYQDTWVYILRFSARFQKEFRNACSCCSWICWPAPKTRRAAHGDSMYSYKYTNDMSQTEQIQLTTIINDKPPPSYVWCLKWEHIYYLLIKLRFVLVLEACCCSGHSECLCSKGEKSCRGYRIYPGEGERRTFRRILPQ